MAFAFAQLEYDELPSLDDSSVVSAKGRYFVGSSLSDFQLTVSAMMLRFEYLRGHIGEKRFTGRKISWVDRSPTGKFARRLWLSRRLCSFHVEGIMHDVNLSYCVR